MKIPNFERILIDSNILVYGSDKKSPFHKKSREVLNQVASGEIKGVLSIQNLLEFYSVITSSRITTQTLTSYKASKELENLVSSGFEIIYPNQETFILIRELIRISNYVGKKIFDLNLVATMLANNVSILLTGNDRDFLPFSEHIRIVNPLKSKKN